MLMAVFNFLRLTLKDPGAVVDVINKNGKIVFDEKVN
jgi:hypothetical protein